MRGDGSLALFQILGNGVVVRMRNRGKQGINDHQLGKTAAHCAASHGNFRCGEEQHGVRIHGQQGLAVLGQSNSGSLALLGHFQNFQDFLGLTGHGDQNGHILVGHAGGIGQTHVVILAEVTVLVELTDGNAEGTAWGCDLTYDYVKINGDYRT